MLVELDTGETLTSEQEVLMELSFGAFAFSRHLLEVCVSVLLLDVLFAWLSWGDCIRFWSFVVTKGMKSCNLRTLKVDMITWKMKLPIMNRLSTIQIHITRPLIVLNCWSSLLKIFPWKDCSSSEIKEILSYYSQPITQCNWASRTGNLNHEIGKFEQSCKITVLWL